MYKHKKTSNLQEFHSEMKKYLLIKIKVIPVDKGTGAMHLMYKHKKIQSARISFINKKNKKANLLIRVLGRRARLAPRGVGPRGTPRGRPPVHLGRPLPHDAPVNLAGGAQATPYGGLAAHHGAAHHAAHACK